MTLDPNAPAFPIQDNHTEPCAPGLTIRAYFAAEAMKPILAFVAERDGLYDVFDNRATGALKHICKAACETADALIAELNK